MSLHLSTRKQVKQISGHRSQLVPKRKVEKKIKFWVLFGILQLYSQRRQFGPIWVDGQIGCVGYLVNPLMIFILLIFLGEDYLVMRKILRCKPSYVFNYILVDVLQVNLCQKLLFLHQLQYPRHDKPLLIRSRSLIQTIHKDRIFWKNILEKKEMVFKKLGKKYTNFLL